jgi:hypothetical protein
MNIKVKDKILLINHDGIQIQIKPNDLNQDILDLVSFDISADDIVTEVLNEIDMQLTEVVSGRFVTDAFYGLSKDNRKVFISRDTVVFNPNIFNQVSERAELPFYVINNRYSMNSVTKLRYQFARVFQTEDEMMKVYRNTVSYLKLQNIIKNL